MFKQLILAIMIAIIANPSFASCGYKLYAGDGKYITTPCVEESVSNFNAYDNMRVDPVAQQIERMRHNTTIQVRRCSMITGNDAGRAQCFNEIK